MVEVPILRFISNIPADLLNVVRFGPAAPRRYQTIYVAPNDVRFIVRDPGRYKKYSLSGRVLEGDWDKRGASTQESWARSIIRERILYNKTWEELGAYDRMMQAVKRRGGMADGCRTLEDIRKRYAALDVLISHLKNGGQFLSRREMDSASFRECGGVVIHVARKGELLFSEKGNHRLAIAQEIGLSRIPAQVGVVHLQAVVTGAFCKLTRRPQELLIR